VVALVVFVGLAALVGMRRRSGGESSESDKAIQIRE